jgi:hypothetical protein
MPLRRIERLHFRPNLVERSMKNFGVAASAIAEKLEGKPARAGIKTGEEISRHVLVVRWRDYCEIAHCWPLSIEDFAMTGGSDFNHRL